MNEDTIVAIYDTPEHAETAANALRSAGVPENAITLHAGTGGTGTGSDATAAGSAREPGFWSGVLGGDTDHDATVYDRSLQAGSTVVSVKTPEQYIDRVMQILESHGPVDIDERAAGYGLTGASTAAAATAPATASPMAQPQATQTRTTQAQATQSPTAPGMMRDTSVSTARADDATLQLSEETLAVGKRAVNRGGTRIRRYVVEQPVEQTVTLHDEKVVLDRRPVTDGRTVQAGDFSDKTIEMMETTEEPVVSKSAHVYEEVGLRKEATDRVETVRDTVRKEEVEVEQVPGSTKPITPSGT